LTADIDDDDDDDDDLAGSLATFDSAITRRQKGFADL
jgi:hypothetical protein